MRLFVAVDLDEAVRQTVAELSRRLQRRCEAVGRDEARGLKWVEPCNLHLTLHFIGDVQDDRLPAMTGALSSVATVGAFSMTLSGVDVFPASGPPRVVWINVTAGREPLSSLHSEVGRQLAGLGLRLETRAFTAHLTVARVKRPVLQDLRAVLAGVPPDAPATWRVDHLTLYRSHLSSAGSRYEALLRAPLGP